VCDVHIQFQSTGAGLHCSTVTHSTTLITSAYLSFSKKKLHSTWSFLVADNINYNTDRVATIMRQKIDDFQLPSSDLFQWCFTVMASDENQKQHKCSIKNRSYIARLWYSVNYCTLSSIKYWVHKFHITAMTVMKYWNSRTFYTKFQNFQGPISRTFPVL